MHPSSPTPHERRAKRRLTLRGFLSIIVILVSIRQIIAGNYENVFLCALTLILFAIPVFIDRHLGIDLPAALEGIIYLFIFSAEILGEINSFYTKIPYWDTILHTINGFLAAAIGVALIDILNRSDKFSFQLSPLFVAVVAFCFSMTIGVLWEFFEFGMDYFFHTDMQKDFIITQISSVTLNPSQLNDVVHMPIDSLVVNGQDWIAKYGGYIDIGIIDTMKDLLVNFIGAVVFSVIGFFYVKTRGKGNFARKFIPTLRHKKANSTAK